MNSDVVLSLFPIVILVAFVSLAYALIQQRGRREAQRMELHAKLIERVGSAREFGEFLGSPAGERFLDALAPARPTNRLWTSVRLGTFAIVFALFVIGADFVHLFNADLRVFVTFAWLTLAFGIAVLASAAISYKTARRLGIEVPADDRIRPSR